MPIFVVPALIPPANPARLREVQGGVYDLLSDTQVFFTGDQNFVYRRQARKVVDRSGLEDAAKTSIDFDPSRETLAIHDVAIIRDGKVIDVSRSAQSETIRRESASNNDVWTGVMTTVIRVPKLRIGDVVDIGWSWHTRRSDWPGQIFASYDLRWSVPVASTHVRLISKAARPLIFKYHEGAPAPVVHREGSGTSYEWTLLDPDPITDEKNQPDWYRPWASVSVSTMAGWGDVVAWALPLYATGGPLPPDLAARVDAIAAGTSDPSRRTLAALRMVQDEIRYTSLSIGSGSYHPRTVAAVWRSGFGDCKDKAQLLVALLGHMGIRAWPALADSDMGASLPQRLPAPTEFDHVITLVDLAGKPVWLDPTISLQGGTIATIADLPYRWALPIRAGQATLMAMPWRPSVHPTQVATETYRLGRDGISLDVRTIYMDDEADSIRQRIASVSVAGLEKSYFDYYRNRYAGLDRTQPLRVRDDRDHDIVELLEGYHLSAAALAKGGMKSRFTVTASSIEGVYKLLNAGIRRGPIALPFPINRVHRIVMITPGVRVPPPSANRRNGPGFRYAFDVDRARNALTLEYRLFGKRPELAAKWAEQERADVAALNDDLSWDLALDRGPISIGEAVAVLVVMVVGLVVLSLALLHGYRVGREYRPEHFYPIPVSKLLILSMATMGLYAVYWQYRCWKQIAFADEDRILPFWRAFFAIFWFYKLFGRVNRDVEPPVAEWAGQTGAIGYFLWAIGLNMVGRLTPSLDTATVALSGFGSVFIVPALLAVNRSNTAEAVRTNGRYSVLAVIGAVTGLSFITAVIWTEI